MFQVQFLPWQSGVAALGISAMVGQSLWWPMSWPNYNEEELHCPSGPPERKGKDAEKEKEKGKEEWETPPPSSSQDSNPSRQTSGASTFCILPTRHRHASCPSELFIKSTLQQLRLAVSSASRASSPGIPYLPYPCTFWTSAFSSSWSSATPLGRLLLQRFMHFFSVCIGNVCCFSSKTNATVLRPICHAPPNHDNPYWRPDVCKKLPSLTIRVSGFSIFLPPTATATVAVRAEVALS